jgi:hypothetical protein
MQSTRFYDLTISLAIVAVLALCYHLDQPMTLDWEIQYSSSATGAATLTLSGDDDLARPPHDFSIGQGASQKSVKAHIEPLQEMPSRARIELELPVHAQFLVHQIHFSMSRAFMESELYVELVDVLEVEGVKFHRRSDSVAFERDARKSSIDVSLEGLQERMQWKSRSLALWLCLSILVYSFLRALRCRPWKKCAKFGIYGLFFAMFIVQALFYIKYIPPGQAPDERAHLSYIAHLQESGRWYPDFESMPIYYFSGEASDQISHLGHPPVYYLLFSPFSSDQVQNVMLQWRHFRSLNLGLAACALALMFWIGMRQRLPLAFHFMYVLILTSIPMLPYLAASINNDNLAIFSGALIILGTLLALEGKPGAKWLLGIGVCLAPLAKATAGLQASIFIVFILFMLWRDGASIRELLTRFGLTLAAGAAPPLLYYGYTIAQYGTPLPIFGTMDYKAPQGIALMDFIAYLGHFQNFLQLSWSGIVSHQTGLPRYAWPQNGAMTLVPLFALWGLFISTKRFSPQLRHLFLVAKSGIIALLGFAVIHFIKVYLSYVETGYIGGIQARYYLPFAACLVIGAIIPLYRWRTRRWTLVIGIIAVADLLYSNVFMHTVARY